MNSNFPRNRAWRKARNAKQTKFTVGIRGNEPTTHFALESQRTIYRKSVATTAYSFNALAQVPTRTRAFAQASRYRIFVNYAKQKLLPPPWYYIDSSKSTIVVPARFPSYNIFKTRAKKFHVSAVVYSIAAARLNGRLIKWCGGPRALSRFKKILLLFFYYSRVNASKKSALMYAAISAAR